MLSVSHLFIPSFLGVFGLFPSSLSISAIILGVSFGKYYKRRERSAMFLNTVELQWLEH